MKSLYIIDPYYSDSHRFWAEMVATNLNAIVRIFQQSAVHWKWRMEGSAVELAKSMNAIEHTPDAFLVTDFLNLGLFKSLLEPRFHECPIVLYMHENQLTYPVSGLDTDAIQKRDNHYGFMNYTSCLVADHIAFNSEYHRKSFLDGLNNLSKKLPSRLDIQSIANKSSIIYPTIDGNLFHALKPNHGGLKTLIWNHRWEYDKRPDVFLDAMISLKQKGFQFQLILLGRMNESILKKHATQLAQLNDYIQHIGFAPTKDDYYSLLSEGDIIVSTSIHDFFGISVLEGIFAGCRPALPFDLAYPELVPDEMRDQIFYKRDRLLDHLIYCLSDKWSNDDQVRLRSYIQDRFTWQHVKSKYEDLLEIN